MQGIMTDKVGIFREGAKLEQAVAELQALVKRSRNIARGIGAVRGPIPSSSPRTARRRC